MNVQNESMAMVRELARGELSVKARLGYVALLLVSAAMTVVILSLWITEPRLPLRTHGAFGVMSLIGLSWVSLATWALTTRRVLLARDRVIAGGMSVVFTGLFLAGSFAAVLVSGRAAAWGAMAMGAAMFVVALRVLALARRRFDELARSRDALARDLAR